MAQYPSRFDAKFRLQPGARGESFKINMPGYRDKDGDFKNRTNMNLPTNEHDTLNTKYLLDRRLPVLFTYGFGYGFNQIVVPKGRLLAADPIADAVDFDTQKQFNIATLANGGCPVRLRTADDKYPEDAENKLFIAKGVQVGNVGIEYIPVQGLAETYADKCYRSCSVAGEYQTDEEILTAAGYAIDPETAVIYKADDATKAPTDVRAANVPLGIATRNEYTRDDDAFNGMAVGAINTDCIIKLPWFAAKDKAEGNPWGSVYGGIFPGCLVKSDENGRFTISPLSFPSVLKGMSAPEIEAERQQVVGKVVSVLTDLVPEGAARWATWALKDRMDFIDFNPDEWAQNGRRGEDVVPRTPYASSGKYPGYMYDRNYGAHDLHMFASIRKNYDIRMQPEYQYENLGIPGLTDGYNAVNREYQLMEIARLYVTKNATEVASVIVRLPEVCVNEVEIVLGVKDDEKAVKLSELVGENEYSVYKYDGSDTGAKMAVTYADDRQAIFRIGFKDVESANTAADALLEEDQVVGEIPVYAKFKKRGLAGIPTFLDWDGVQGSASILLEM